MHAEVVVNFRESERGLNQERAAALDGVLGRGTARFDGLRWSVRGESAVYRHRGAFCRDCAASRGGNVRTDDTAVVLR